MKKYLAAKGGQKQVRGSQSSRVDNGKRSAGMILLMGMSLSVSAVHAGVVLVPAPGNTATGNRSVVVTGLSNTASGNGSFIGSGVSHTASGFFSATLAGQSNTASGSLSSVVGGKLNLATGEGSFVGGGLENEASGIRSGVLSGFSNKATGLESGVFAGRGNTADGNYAAVAAGIFNTATGPGAIVGGGSTNQAFGQRSGVFTGKSNTANGVDSAVLGGNGNTVQGASSVIVGGREAVAAGDDCLIFGRRLTDDGFDGNVMLTDSDPTDSRNGSPFRSTVSDKFTALFQNGTCAIGTSGVSVSDPTCAFTVTDANDGWSTRFDGRRIQAIDHEFNDESILFVNPNGGNVEIGSMGNTTTIKGTFVNPSDRNIKEDIKPVSNKDVLERLVDLPVSTWRYKGGERGHIGPMAQDFHAAFDDLLNLNSDDKTIAPLDEAGIAFTSIQALHEMVEEKNAEIGALNKRLEKLEALLSSETR